jgi:hypothetical protein
VIGVNLTFFSIEIVPPNLQCENYRSELQVMNGVVQLVVLELPRSVRYYFTVLHMNAAESSSRSIAINNKFTGS